MLSQLQTVLVSLGAAAIVGMAYSGFGWPGVALAVGAIVMWVLLHFTRMLGVLRRAANRPKGHVDSAVMLNARLNKGMSMLQVVGLTRAMGEEIAPLNAAESETWKWTDPGNSAVNVRFVRGKVLSWELLRPAAQTTTEAAADPTADATPPAAP
jgi:hypothetical protein